MEEYDHTEDLDGDMTLEDTKNRCQLVQNSGFQLADIRFGTKVKRGQTFLINKAGFMERLSNRLNVLNFVEVKTDQTASDVKNDEKYADWTFICDGRVYDSKNTKHVVVFGKKQ